MVHQSRLRMEVRIPKQHAQQNITEIRTNLYHTHLRLDPYDIEGEPTRTTTNITPVPATMKESGIYFRGELVQATRKETRQRKTGDASKYKAYLLENTTCYQSQ